MVVSHAWPKCSRPVTFGGGITMVNGSFSLSPVASKNLPSTQYRYLSFSISFGLYFEDMNVLLSSLTMDSSLNMNICKNKNPFHPKKDEKDLIPWYHLCS